MYFDEDDLKRIFLWTGGIIGLIIIVFVGIPALWNAGNASYIRREKENIAVDLQSLQTRLPVAQATHEKWAPHFVQRYSLELSGLLKTAQRYVFGPLTDSEAIAPHLQAVADQEGKREWDKAKAEVAVIHSKLGEAAIPVNRILGPPDAKTYYGWYDDLLKKQSLVENGYVTTAQSAVDTARTKYVTASRAMRLCDETTAISYKRASAALTNADGKMLAATAAATTVIEDGLRDLPLAYDQAHEAEAFAADATVVIDNAPSELTAAKTAIGTAKSDVASAQTYVDRGENKFSAQQYVDGANRKISAAELQCNVDEDFMGAKANADSAVSDAASARRTAATATPEPPPTAVPVHIHVDTSTTTDDEPSVSPVDTDWFDNDEPSSSPIFDDSDSFGGYTSDDNDAFSGFDSPDTGAFDDFGGGGDSGDSGSFDFGE